MPGNCYLVLFILPSDNVQHDLHHSLITHNFPERREPRKQKEFDVTFFRFGLVKNRGGGVGGGHS